MAQERPGHTLQTTALVNEVYLRLMDIREVTWQDRTHFFASPDGRYLAFGDVSMDGNAWLIESSGSR